MPNSLKSQDARVEIAFDDVAIHLREALHMMPFVLKT